MTCMLTPTETGVVVYDVLHERIASVQLCCLPSKDGACTVLVRKLETKATNNFKPTESNAIRSEKAPIKAQQEATNYKADDGGLI